MSVRNEPPPNAPAVVIVGSYVHDHVWLTERFPDTGETLGASGFVTGPGGKGFNQAVACHRQGVPITFIGAIGNDALGDAARRFAVAEGLDCRWLQRDDLPTGAASIAVDRSGANRILVNFAANEHLDTGFIESHEPMFMNARVVLAQLENNLDAVRAALDLGARYGALRMLNPAPVHRDIDAALLGRCDLITPNENEMMLLLARISGQRVDAHEITALADEALHAVCRALDVPTVVVTLGAAGCFVSHGVDRRGDDKAFYRVDAERVQAIDTVGAGDAFNGALAAALSRRDSRPFRAAIVRANRVAALSTETVGASLAMPRAAAVDARFGAH